MKIVINNQFGKRCCLRRGSAVCSSASGARWDGGSGGVSGSGGSWGGLVRWDYVLFLSSITASSVPKLPCPTAGQTQTRHGPHTDPELDDTLLKDGQRCVCVWGEWWCVLGSGVYWDSRRGVGGGGGGGADSRDTFFMRKWGQDINQSRRLNGWSEVLLSPLVAAVVFITVPDSLGVI